MSPTEPHYRRILREVRERIAAGEFAAGAKLPSTAELAEQYSVSPPTVRQAITLMLETGELTGHQGVGVFVATKP